MLSDSVTCHLHLLKETYLLYPNDSFDGLCGIMNVNYFGVWSHRCRCDEIQKYITQLFMQHNALFQVIPKQVFQSYCGEYCTSLPLPPSTHMLRLFSLFITDLWMPAGSRLAEWGTLWCSTARSAFFWAALSLVSGAFLFLWQEMDSCMTLSQDWTHHDLIWGIEASIPTPLTAWENVCQASEAAESFSYHIPPVQTHWAWLTQSNI